jgi:hypothetical protein
MWMKHQVLSPTVQHGEEADLGAEMFGVGGNGAQGFRSGPKENVVHHFLVLVSDGGNLFRESKDDMEILGVEELGLTILDPLGPCQGHLAPPPFKGALKEAIAVSRPATFLSLLLSQH